MKTLVRVASLATHVVRKDVPGDRIRLTLDAVVDGAPRIATDAEAQPIDDQVAFEPGDVLFSKLRPYLAKSVLVTEPLFGTAEFITMVPTAGVDARFLYFATRTTPWLEWSVATSYGTKMPRTSWEAMREFRLKQVPSLTEQRRIADFLQDQVARLDRAIALRQEQSVRSSDRLNARREALIAEASPTVMSLRRVADFLQDGDWIESPFIDDSGIRLLQTGNVGVGVFKDQGSRYISRQTFDLLGCTQVCPGDVLISRLSPPVGRACLAPDNGEELIVSVDVAILRSRSVNHRYLVQALSTTRYLDEVDLASRGATMARVSRSQLASFKVPIVAPAKQLFIADAMEHEFVSSQALQAANQRHIGLLAERKQALITAAVNGEFDVSTARGMP